MTNIAPSDSEDIDLQDLIQDGEPSDVGSPSTSKSTSPSKGKQQYSNYYSRTYSASPQTSIISRLPELLCYYLTSFFLNNPFLGKITVLGFLGLIIFGLLTVTGQTTQSIGEIKYNFSNVKSQYDFDISKIDHWCVGGGNQCQCPDPLDPTPRLHKSWYKAVETHKNDISKEPRPDIVFLGQTLVEAFNARINGHDMDNSEYFGKVKHQYTSKFHVTGEEPPTKLAEGEHMMTATALGLTGDSSSNILWRLMNGELPDGFNPPIWWLVIGMEDVGRFACSEEITVMGILRIVEFIKDKRPDAKIVINSLLPMIKLRMAEARDEEEFVDAERAGGKGPKPRERKGDKTNRKRHHDENLRYLKGSASSQGEDGEEFIGKRSKREIKKQQKKMMKELEKRKREYLKQVKHDKFNPTMKDVKRWRKKGRHSEKRIPMWSAIHSINQELHKFCQRTPHVTFFDATEIFAINENGRYTMSTELISPRGHPTVKGFKKWFEEISNQAQVWKKKMIEQEEDEFETIWNMQSDEYYKNLPAALKATYPEGHFKDTEYEDLANAELKGDLDDDGNSGENGKVNDENKESVKEVSNVVSGDDQKKDGNSGENVKVSDENKESVEEVSNVVSGDDQKEVEDKKDAGSS